MFEKFKIWKWYRKLENGTVFFGEDCEGDFSEFTKIDNKNVRLECDIPINVMLTIRSFLKIAASSQTRFWCQEGG